MDTNVKRREWVKTAAIIFLAVLLVLTFFSNTIMNASLPEVATQQVTQGTINAKIRASGTITANETYNVKLAQSRKIESVKCKVGQAVNAGDVLFVLEAQESDELKAAKTDLEAKELDYQKSLITASNDSAQEDRDVQKLRDAYNEALTIYNQYSSMDASQIAIEKAKAEKKLNELTKDSERAQKELTNAQNDEEYTKISGEISALEATLEPLKTAKDKAEKALDDMDQPVPILDSNPDHSSDRYAYLIAKYEDDYLLLQKLAGSRKEVMAAYCNEPGYTELKKKLISSGEVKTDDEAATRAEELNTAYVNLQEYYDDVSDLQADLAKYKAQLTYVEARDAYDEANSNTSDLRERYNSLKAAIERLEIAVENAKDAVDEQTEVVSDLGKAADNASAVKTAKEALEDKLFEMNKGDTAALDMSKTLAIVTSQGGPTSHTAILARARGIVAVVSAAEAAELENGTNVIVNAAKGEIVVNPSEDEIAAAEAAKSRAAAAKELRGKPGATKDGHLIPLLANVGKPSDAAKALEYGAEGVGLFRTEFLFIGNSEPPSVEEQTKAYTELLSQFPGKKVVIRMLDAGADKPLPFLTPEDEPNPALGLRGLRTLRAHMDVLEGQLKALAAADAATDANLWVMAPMVADQHEADYFVKLGKSFGLKFVGAMAEVPSIALMADKVADVADFVSIGTNDLTQYTLAADRTLGSVANYQTAWHPAVLRAIKMICDAGNAKGMPVGVCGEAAADPDLAVVLAGLGVNSLSMTPVALDDVRASLAEVTFEEAKAKAAAALNGDFYKPAE